MEFIDTVYNEDFFYHIFKLSETNFGLYDQGRDCFKQGGNIDKSCNMDKFFWVHGLPGLYFKATEKSIL